MAGVDFQRQFDTTVPGQERNKDRRLLRRQRSLDYWGGRTWVWRGVGTCSNAAHDILISPGEGSELEFLYGMHFFTAAGARSFQMNVLDENGDINTQVFDSLNFNTGVRVNIPWDATRLGLGDAGAGPYSRLIVSGRMALQFVFSSMLVTETTTDSMTCRIRGNKPTVTPSASYTAFSTTSDRVI